MYFLPMISHNALDQFREAALHVDPIAVAYFILAISRKLVRAFHDALITYPSQRL